MLSGVAWRFKISNTDYVAKASVEAFLFGRVDFLNLGIMEVSC